MIRFPSGQDVCFQVDSRYQILQPLGEGAYGHVVSAYDTLMKRNVAIKKYLDPLLNPDFANEMKRTLREMKLLRHFRSHENIVTVYDLMTYPLGVVNFQDLYVVTNLYDSDLENVLKLTTDGDLSAGHQQFFLYQILRGLKYIHSANIIHRDLKPSNILLNTNCDLAICDFGLSREIDIDILNQMNNPLTQYVAARWYRAPELLCEIGNYSKGVDMWSVGCIFAEILNRQTPFFNGHNCFHQLITIITKLNSANCLPSIDGKTFRHSKMIQAAIAKCQAEKLLSSKNELSDFFPTSTSPLALDLLKKMLTFNPHERITVEEALSHPYLSKLHDISDEPICHKLFKFANSSLGDNKCSCHETNQSFKKMKTDAYSNDISASPTSITQLSTLNTKGQMNASIMQALIFKEIQLYRPLSTEVLSFLSDFESSNHKKSAASSHCDRCAASCGQL